MKSSLPFANPDRCKEWRQEALAIGASVVALWTGLDCALDPGVRPLEDPIGLLKIALPTALLVAPGAAVAACARLKPTPADFKGPAGVVMVGDSLTQGTVSANVLEVLAERGRRRGQTLGSLVNGGLNFRALSDVGPELLQRAADLKPSHGLVLQLGSNDLIRYLAAPEWLRPAEEEWLQTYAEQMRQAALELRCGGEVLLVSPPPLGEALGSLEFDLGAKMAKAVEAVAADVGCGYVPLFEACVKFLQRSREVDSSAGTRGYSLAEFLPRLCLLPWRLYVGQQSLSQIQAEEETKLTLDLVHFGDSYAQLAADLLEEKLGLLK